MIGAASLQETLNGDYLNRTGSYNSTGITSQTRVMIATVTWKLGGLSNGSNTTATFYNAERGTTVYSGRIMAMQPVVDVQEELHV